LLPDYFLKRLARATDRAPPSNTSPLMAIPASISGAVFGRGTVDVEGTAWALVLAARAIAKVRSENLRIDFIFGALSREVRSSPGVSGSRSTWQHTYHNYDCVHTLLCAMSPSQTVTKLKFFGTALSRYNSLCPLELFDLDDRRGGRVRGMRRATTAAHPSKRSF